MARSKKGRSQRPRRKPSDSPKPSEQHDPGPSTEDEEFVEYDEDSSEDADTEDADAEDAAEDADSDDSDDDTDDEDEDSDDEDTDDDEDDEDPDDEDEDRPARSGRRDLTRSSSRSQKSRGSRPAKKATGNKGGARSGKRRGSSSPLGTDLDDPKLSRRERMASMEAEARRTKRRRTLGLVLVCVVLAVAVLAWPTYLFIDDAITRATPRDQIGVPAAQAGCLEEVKHPATGNQQHVPDGTIVEYTHLPPDSGPHLEYWAAFGTTFYSWDDRPPVEQLVHNLEHGYTIVWYNADTISDSDLKWIEALGKTFSGNDPRTNKFIAAPWSPNADGGSFPEDTNFLMVRWIADPENPTDTTQQFGVRQACAQLSGEAVVQFMERHPQPNSPEPNGG